MFSSTRRDFLSRLLFAETPAVSDPGAHTMVCVFLRGGADTLNMLVPYGDGDYYANRPTLSISRPPKIERAGEAIRLDDFYALHPMMAPIAPIFRDGRFGFVQAVGSDNPTGSHFDAQDQIEHGEKYGASLGGGWLGRHLRARAGASGPLTSVAIGATIPESLRTAPAATAFSSLDEVQLPQAAGDPQALARALGQLYSTEVGILGAQGRETLDLLARVQTLRGQKYQPAKEAAYPTDDFGSAMREVARVIKADLGLEVACVDLGGWDTHFFQGTTAGAQAGPIETLAKGLAAFDADLAGPWRKRVTTIVMTEFGRRLYENGSAGTDHGRGFALMAMGDRINGGRIHGSWPGLKEDDPTLPGPGGMPVQIDYRQVLAEVLQATSPGAKVDQVFPGLQAGDVGLMS